LPQAICRAAFYGTNGRPPSPRGRYFLSALLLVVTGENLPLRYQPVLVFVTWRVSPFFVQLVRANADFFLQIYRGRTLFDFEWFQCRHGCYLLATCAAVARGFCASHNQMLLN